MFIIFPIIFALLGIALAIFLFVFWVKMIIHAASAPIENRVAWILVVIFVSWIGAIIYYYSVYKKTPNVLTTAPVTPVTPEEAAK